MSLFSVVIPTYNRAGCLADAVASVESQTLKDWEVIVVDDGSTDHTAELCTRLKRHIGDRFRYLPRDHAGVAAARNAGIAASSAELIAFLDSDDQFYPEKLGIQASMLKHLPDADLAFSSSHFRGFYKSDEKGVELPIGLMRSPYPELLYIRNNVIMTPSVVIRRATALAAGGFDEDMTMCEDLDLWRRISRTRKAVAFSRPLVMIQSRKPKRQAIDARAAARLLLYKKAFQEDPEFNASVKRLLHVELAIWLKNTADEYRRASAGMLLLEIAGWLQRLTDDATAEALCFAGEWLLFAAAAVAGSISAREFNQQAPNFAKELPPNAMSRTANIGQAVASL